MCDSCQFYPVSVINTDQMNAHFTVIEILLDVSYAHNDAIQSQIHTFKETDAHTMLNIWIRQNAKIG